MSDFGYRPPKISLMDQKLTLSPETERLIAQIRADMAAKAWLDRLLNPTWDLTPFEAMTGQPPPVTVSPPNPFLTMPPPVNPFFTVPPALPGKTATQPLPPPPDPFPTGPRPGEMKDVMAALWKLPVVVSLLKDAKGEADRQFQLFQRDFKAMPTGEKAIFISTSAIVAAGFIAPIIANQKTRLLAFDFLKNKDISVPGVGGLTFKILDHGAGVGMQLFVPGLKLDSSLDLPGKSAVNFNATLSWDVMEFIRSQSK